MYVDGVTADQIFNDCSLFTVFDIEIPVVSAIHLAMMKAFACNQDPTRIQDLTDIAELYKRNVLSEKSVKEISDKFGYSDYFRKILSEGERDE